MEIITGAEIPEIKKSNECFKKRYFKMKFYKTISLWILVTIFTLISGCVETTTNIFEDNAKGENHPPQILLSSHEYDSLSQFKNEMPIPWVIVGDEDGQDDIAAVVLNIEKINIVSLIVRPDDSTNECSTPFYADMDTIDVTPFLKKMTFNISNKGIHRGNNGVYSAYLYYFVLTDNGIESHGDVFGASVKPCYSGYTYLTMFEHFGLYPPALPAPRDVYVTYVKLFISDISITVYDHSGASASVKFPDFYGIFSNPSEDKFLP